MERLDLRVGFAVRGTLCYRICKAGLIEHFVMSSGISIFDGGRM